MKRLCHVFVLFAFFVSPSYAQFPSHVWSQRFGGSRGDDGIKVTVDGLANVIVTGRFEATADFGAGPLVSAGGTDVFLAKYDANGVPQWSKRFGGTLADGSFDVATDASGNVIVTGEFEGMVDFGGGSLTSAGGRDIFIASYDATGAHRWSRRFGNFSDDRGYSVATDAGGFVVAAGRFRFMASFGGPIIDTHTYFNDIFVAKYDTNGNHVWSRGFGDTSTSVDGIAVTTDASGGIFLTGAFTGTTDFGGGPLTSSESDVFLAKYDASGVHQWSKGFGSVPRDVAYDVATDPAGNVAITGNFGFHTNGGTIDFGGGPLVGAGSTDIFVAKFDGSGIHLWSRAFGDTDFDQGNAITADADGSVAVTGRFRIGADFGGGYRPVAGQNDVFVAKFDATGVHQWSQSFGGNNSEIGNGIAVDPSGAVLLTGHFGSPTNFGGGTLTGAGANDIFIAKFDDPLPIPVLVTNFQATGRAGAIDIRWSLWSDESIEDLTLYRRADGEQAPVMLSSWRYDSRERYTDSAVEPGRLYYYELAIESSAGNIIRSPIASATAAAALAALGQNHPNPFNPATSIEYTLSERTATAIAIYRVNGEIVTRLDRGVQGPGVYRAVWDGRNSYGSPVASGVYFYRMEGLPSLGTRKMVLLK